VQVAVHPVSSTAERIDQSVYFVERSQKRSLLHHLLSDSKIERALVFTRTKHGANRVAEFLAHAKVPAAAIHGNKSQGARERALSQFISGEIRVLVATDIAARGIDIDGISHVINFDLPNQPESYVHRIGRTGRAGASGTALSFCDAEEREYLADIEKVIGRAVPRAEANPFPSNLAAPAPADSRPQQSRPHQAPRSPREARQRAKGQEHRPRGEHSRGAPQRHSESSGQGRPQQQRTERPQGQRPQQQRTERPQGQRPQGQRPQGHRPAQPAHASSQPRPR
jgi:ATP-dependent RNA helicase RhlE